MITTIFSATPHGVGAQIISVEAEVAGGMSLFTIVGLPDTRVQEARGRIRSAIKQSGFQFPYNFRLTVNLAPADVRKEGTGFDLPIALALLGKVLQLPTMPHALFVGELALDGTVRSVRGVLAAAREAKRAGLQAIFIPTANAAEVALVDDIEIYPISNLRQVVSHILGASSISRHIACTADTPDVVTQPLCDLANIFGNQHAKRALEIAAVGMHHILLNGPPGVGKTLLARAMQGIMSNLSREESMEVTQIYSSAGLAHGDELPIRARPFRSPHHSASAPALIGGGAHMRPGEITLAHHGVLFLDELPEFQRPVLEQLRQPLEDGEIVLRRADKSALFPARFILVGAQNPCPCGYLTDPHHECRCSAVEKMRYARKISGPLIDRMDLYSDVSTPTSQELTAANDAHNKNIINTEPSSTVRERVKNARAFAHSRATDEITHAAQTLAVAATERMRLSARGYYKLLRVSRSIADLQQCASVTDAHVAEALTFRFNERT